MKASDIKFYIVERHCHGWLYEHQVAVIAEDVLLRGCQVVGLPVLRSVLRPHSLPTDLSVYVYNKYRLFCQGIFRDLLKFVACELSDPAISKHPAVALMCKRGSVQGLSVERIGARVICGKHRYTGCPRRNVPNFGRVFLMLNYTDITQNTYIQSWTVAEIMAIEKCGLLGCPRTVSRPWRHTHSLRMSGNETS